MASLGLQGILRSDKYLLIDRILVFNIFLLLVLALVFRLVAIENIPGVSGDEAWYGVQMVELLNGREVSWRTPAGNILNPFHSGVILMLQAVFSSAIWILRAPALVAGILLLPLTYLLIRKVADDLTALVMLIFVAVLPINIIYSRYGWDPSQTGLASLIAIFFALRRQWLGLGLSFMAALIVYPTNAFLLPILLGPTYLYFWVNKDRPDIKHGPRIMTVLSLGASLLLMRLFFSPRAGLPPIDVVWLRFVDYKGWFNFFNNYNIWLSGVTLYQQIAGSVSSLSVRLHTFLFWITFLPVVLFGLRALIRQRANVFLGFVGGMVLSLISFQLVVPWGMTPGYDRYALFLVIPSLMLVAMCIRALMTTPLRQRILLSVTILVGYFMLGSFVYHYFGAILDTGGQSHRTYRTAAVEPKKQALTIVLNDLADEPRNSEVAIIVEDWWLYWPIRYLASENERIVVKILSKDSDSTDQLLATLDSGGYAVVYPRGVVEKLIRYHFPGKKRHLEIVDYADKPLLSVWRMEWGE